MDSLVSTEWLAANLHAPDLVVFDCSTFLPNEAGNFHDGFRAAHIPGSRWAVRGRIPAFAKPVVVTAPDPVLADLAAAEIPGARVLAGGVAAWRAAGLPLASDRHHPEDADCVDWYLRPYDRNSGQEAAMHDYLRWEVDLVHGVARDGDARFGAW